MLTLSQNGIINLFDIWQTDCYLKKKKKKILTKPLLVLHGQACPKWAINGGCQDLLKILSVIFYKRDLNKSSHSVLLTHPTQSIVIVKCGTKILMTKQTLEFFD